MPTDFDNFYNDTKNELNKEISKSKDKLSEFSKKEINLDFMERFTRMIYLNPTKLAKLEMLQYILFIAIIYYYNPLGIKTEYPVFTKLLIITVSFTYVMLFFFIKMKIDHNEDVDLIYPTEKNVLTKFILLIVVFIGFMFCIKGFIWLLINTSLVTLLTDFVSLLLIVGALAIVYLFMRKKIDKIRNSKQGNMLNLIVKIIMYLPCLLIDITEYIKYEYHLTTKPVWTLIGFESVFIVLWFLIPIMFDKVVNHSGKKLVNKPLNLNKEYTVGKYDELYDIPDIDHYDLSEIDKSYNNKKNDRIRNEKEREKNKEPTDRCCDENKALYTEGDKDIEFEKNTDPNIPKNKIMAWFYKKIKNPTLLKVEFKVNPQPGINGDDYRFRYKYAISGWFYLNPQPPNTNPSYNKYTNIIKYGNKVRVEYNGKKNSLRVMAEVASSNKDNLNRPAKNDTNSDNIKNKSVIVYESNDVIYQKWNNIVINYNEGFIDVFLNGVLVGSYSSVAPYMKLDEIVTGSENGIYGGICNVTYYNDVLNEKNIIMSYKTLRIKEMPYVWSITDDISINIEKNKNPDKKFINDIKAMLGVQ
jgi:hypothetical protein